MSGNKKSSVLYVPKANIKYSAKALYYPCGMVDLMACSHPIFGPSGWENSGWNVPKYEGKKEDTCKDVSPNKEGSLERSMRRAKANVRRLALANDFKYFVTLTLDPAKVDAHDGKAVVQKLNAWASNAVQRNGLKYILVPERHKKGGIHFHGFFNDVLPAIDSGTMRLPWAKRPRKWKTEEEKNEWLKAGGKIVYNLPNWTLGFTTAMELYGEYPAAVSYVCKYIGKDGTKPAGRWYYSGGALEMPKVEYFELSPADLAAEYGEKVIEIYPPGKKLAIVNGLKVHEQVQKE